LVRAHLERRNTPLFRLTLLAADPRAGFIGGAGPKAPRTAMPEADITQMLVELSGGNREAMDRLLPAIYEQLRLMARRELRRERPGHTLTPTALVHEAYLKLVQLERVDWRGRAHFFGACAREMRRILISYARMKKADKRGGGVSPVTLENVMVAAESRPGELLALDEALVKLEALSARQARIVECRFFAGMSVEETAAALEISPATVKREWTAARAWLNRELTA